MSPVVQPAGTARRHSDFVSSRYDCRHAVRHPQGGVTNEVELIQVTFLYLRRGTILGPRPGP